MSISVNSPIPFDLILGHKGDVLRVLAPAYIASILYTLDSVPCIQIYMRVCDDLKKLVNFCERIDQEAILVLLIFGCVLGVVSSSLVSFHNWQHLQDDLFALPRLEVLI